MAKHLPTMQTWVRSQGWKDSLRRKWQPTLAWKTPWTEEPGRLHSMGSQRVDMTKQLNFLFFPFKEKTLSEGLKPPSPQSAERLELR